MCSFGTYFGHFSLVVSRGCGAEPKTEVFTAPSIKNLHQRQPEGAAMKDGDPPVGCLPTDFVIVYSCGPRVVFENRAKPMFLLNRSTYSSSAIYPHSSYTPPIASKVEYCCTGGSAKTSVLGPAPEPHENKQNVKKTCYDISLRSIVKGRFEVILLYVLRGRLNAIPGNVMDFFSKKKCIYIYTKLTICGIHCCGGPVGRQ